MIARLPLSIRLFAVLWIMQALLLFVHGLASPDAAVANLSTRLPEFDWRQPAPTILTTVRAAIAAVPLLLIIVRAAGFARWMCLLLTVIRVAQVPAAVTLLLEGSGLAGLWLAAFLAAVAAVAALFTPEARAWFIERRTMRQSRAVFD